MALEPESQWTLKEGYGAGVGSVPAGTVVTLQAVCEPGTPGVGDDGTPSALLTFWEGDLVRALSMPTRDFEERFMPVKKGRARAR